MHLAFGTALKSEIAFFANHLITLQRRRSRSLSLPSQISQFTTGIGQVAALAAVSAVMQGVRPNVLIFAGCAGGTGARYRVGDTVICDGVIGVVGNRSHLIKSDSKLVNIARRAFKGHSRVHIGKAFSSFNFVSSRAARTRLLAYGALCVENEGLAVGTVCSFARVPWIMIRVLVDDVRSREMPSSEFIRGTMVGLTDPLFRLLQHL
jgi:nucleoside phosphorylase